MGFNSLVPDHCLSIYSTVFRVHFTELEKSYIWLCITISWDNSNSKDNTKGIATMRDNTPPFTSFD